ncbi:ABC transporter permease [soil metagenome]
MLAEIRSAVWAEGLKVRRSLVPRVTLAAMTLGGAVGAFFMFVFQDLDRSRKFGLLGDKTELAGGTADWAGHFALTGQIVTIGGLIVFGTVTIWLFGREFNDRTVKDLLALPTSRVAIVVAKLLVAFGWCALLALTLLGFALMSGAVLGLPGWSAEVGLQGVGAVLEGALLTTALTVTYGLVASVTRGYLAAFGALFLSLFTAQVLAAVGYGRWFPWTVPALLAGIGGPEQPDPGLSGVVTVLAVALGSALATVLWWQRADHTT